MFPSSAEEKGASRNMLQHSGIHRVALLQANIVLITMRMPVFREGILRLPCCCCMCSVHGECPAAAGTKYKCTGC